MTDFGRVGHIRTESLGLVTDCTFMVVAPSPDFVVRAKMKDYRWVINLSGVGYVGRNQVLPGEMGPLHMNDNDIEWLDD